MPKDEFSDMLENFDEEEIEVLEDDAVEEETEDDVELEAEEEIGDELKPEEIDEVAELKAQLADRDKTIADIAKGTVKPDEEDEAPKGFQLKEQEWEDREFVAEDLDLEELTPVTLNKMLNAAAKAGADLGAKTAAEQVLLSIPGIVKHSVNIESSIQSAVKDFYSGNQDLLKFKGAVSTVAQELASKNPEWDLTKLFDEAGKETRSRLGITRPGKAAKKPSGPVKPRGQRGRGKGAALSGLESEINEMLETGL